MKSERPLLRRLMLPLRFIITIGMMIFLLIRFDFHEISKQLYQANIFLLALATIIFIGRNWIAGYRWQFLLAIKGAYLRLNVLVRYYLVSNFFGFFMPTAMGGDVIRGYYIYQDGVPLKEGASSLIIERAIGIGAMLFIALTALVMTSHLILDNQLIAITLSGSGLFVFLGFVFFALTDHWVEKLPAIFKRGFLMRIIKLLESIHQYHNYPVQLAQIFFFSLLYNLAVISTYYILSLAVGEHLSINYYLLFLPLIWVVSLLPVSINGLGVRETSFVVLFSSAGMSENTALLISLFYILILLIQAILGGVIWLSLRRDKHV